MTAAPGCIFCRIVAGDIPATVVDRSETVLAFRDLHPQGDTHVLIVPVNHHANVAELAAAEPGTLADLVALGQKIARDETGGSFRLLFHTGAAAGQPVVHATCSAASSGAGPAAPPHTERSAELPQRAGARRGRPASISEQSSSNTQSLAGGVTMPGNCDRAAGRGVPSMDGVGSGGKWKGVRVTTP